MLLTGQARTEIVMPAEPVVIKRYANRRLYNPAAGSYVSIDDLGALVEDEEDFVVYDVNTGDDITHVVLKQIIVERAHHG
jgi:polyhydroxyalkanoate synthesis repressor PhaR